MIEFACPVCDRIGKVPLSTAGKVARCPGCRSQIEIPTPEEVEATAPPDSKAPPTVPTKKQGPVLGEGENKPCPYCGESIRKVAKKCKYCGEFLDARLRVQRRRSSSDPLAPRLTRLASAIVDNLLYMPCAIPMVIGIVVADSRGSQEVGVALIILGVMLMIALAVYQWYLVSTRGQSLAKGWFGIKIVKLDGTEVDFVSGVLLRVWVISFMANIPYVGACVGLIDALMIFADDRRCLHDHMASTKVIQL